MEQWERLDLHMLGVCDPIAADFLPRFLIGAVARTLQPGCDVRQSPVLVGPQWIGKTALGRILFGADHWVSGVGDLGKDALERLHTSWGVELAELDGITRKADQEALKAFLTETCDTYRKPYDRAPERHPRKFVFWATSNGAALRDTTGNTRFVCIPVKRPLPLDWAEQNRLALWARALQQYNAGVQWWGCDEEQRQAIEDRNEDFRELDPWHDVIERALRVNPNGYTTYEDLFEKLQVPVERRNTNATRRVRQLAEACGWEYSRRRRGGENLRGLWRRTDDD
jgi:predicted P-loop ATPase